MTGSSASSFDTALQILQQAATAIIDWASAKGSLDAHKPAALKLVFDQIRLTSVQPNHSQNYCPALALSVSSREKTPPIPYPLKEIPTDQELAVLKEQILDAAQHLDPQKQNLSQLMVFLETYGSHLSWGEPDADVAIVDQAKSTAAIAAALAQTPPDQQLALIAGDLMGVQKFIYTISSDGALRSLRARSFFLEIATEEIVHRLLQDLDLPRTNVIYAGASKLYILAPCHPGKTDQVVQHLQDEFNDWLLRNFQKKVFLAMAVGESFPATDLAPNAPLENNTTRFAAHWQRVNQKLAAQASRKFSRNITDILSQQDSHEPCKVCRRDDTTDLDILNRNDPTSVQACPICRQMFALGGQLLRAKALIRSDRPCHRDETRCFEINGAYYRVITDQADTAQLAQNQIAFQINCWDLTAYDSNRSFPLLLGNYGQEGEEGSMSAREFAEAARGIKRVGYLRADVDRLSQIFSKGLGPLHTLPRVAGLSRQMSYFFKVYLTSLARDRQPNFLDHRESLDFKILPQPNSEKLARRNLLFIYAGGDDLFISGAWDEVVNFAFDLYQSFRAYTGNHPDITLSAGITIADAKFPLYQAAEQAGKLEDKAKDNNRDSLAIFSDVFKWEEWLGNAADSTLTGVLPFVERLLGQNLELNTTRAFVRNLLITAQQQDQLIQEREQKLKQLESVSSTSNRAVIDRLKQEKVDIRAFLHLPRLAYTLERLPRTIRDREEFTPVRISLKQPQNAQYFRAIATWIELLVRNP